MLASQLCSQGAQFLSLLQQEPELTSPRRSAGISSASLQLLAAHRHRTQGPRNVPVLLLPSEDSFPLSLSVPWLLYL